MLAIAAVVGQQIASVAASLAPMTSLSREITGVEQNTSGGQGGSQWTTSTHQYIVFYEGSSGTVTIGQRAINSTAWSFFDLSTDPTYEFGTTTVNDTHYRINVAVDLDGYVHVSGNFHDAAALYMRSTAPNDITDWEAPTPWGASSVSYVTLFQCSDGELLVLFRVGSSALGDMWLWAYDTSTQTWSSRVQITEGTGTGIDPDGNAYWNDPVVDSTGRIHLWWTWRVALTANYPGNIDILYAYSDDNGSTWRKKSDDSAFTLPITAPNGEVVQIVAEDEHLMNGCGAGVDADDNPHSVWKMEDDSGYLNLFHSWHDGSSWQWEQITSWTDASGTDAANHETLSRPRVVCFADGTSWCVYRRNFGPFAYKPVFIDITTPGAPGSETLLVDFYTDEDWYPQVDHRLLAARDEYSTIVGRFNLSNGDSPAPTFQGYQIIVKTDTSLPVSIPDDDFPIAPSKYAFWVDGASFVAEGYSDTNPVPTWPIERGANDLTEATNPPTFDAIVAALNDRGAVSFDGTNDVLSTNYTALSQPYSVVWIGNVRAVEEGMRFACRTSTNGFEIYAAADPYNWTYFAGSSVESSTPVTTGAHIVIANFDGANSSLWVDGVEIANGDPGDNASSAVKLGTNLSGTAAYSDMDVAFIGLCDQPLSDADIATFVDWSATYYGTP